MLNIILFFLFAGLLLYVVLAGADFGAGMLELLSRRKDYERAKRLTYEAIGPVWEANHIWLILVIVILFNGFPEVYATYSTYLHIPLMLMLFGIILRGTTFMFRHYDAIQDGSQRYYSRLFELSSFVTPLFLGMTLGGAMLGRIDPAAPDFYSAYLAPWLNGYSFLVGLFFSAISAFVAAVFLSAETPDDEYHRFLIRAAIIAQVVMVVLGGLVFLAGEMAGRPLLGGYLHSPVAIGTVVLATAAVPFLLRALRARWRWWARFLAGFQVAMILFGWMWVQHPVLIHLADGQALTVTNTAAPEAVQRVLMMALFAGSAFIFPALFYLFKVFKFDNAEAG
ncbi:MAG: cytochrome d ubiquinol oxidase subunit II [Bacteroidetes bacterium]|nr:MAG: cytochrome d ubiquinol oxidase subunit II [Bacteroidota bacterium]